MKTGAVVFIAFLGWHCATNPVSTRPNHQRLPDTGPFRLPPVDEASRDPTFAEFRDRLIAAVKARDAKGVINSSVDELRRRFQRLSLPKSAFAGPRYEDADWVELEELLSLGGSFTTTRGSKTGRLEFCAPYVYSAYPSPEKLAFIIERLPGRNENPESDPWVILGRHVPGRSAPSEEAAPVVYFSHDLVLAAEARGTPVQWQAVYVTDIVQAWLAADQIRSPSDYHACFATIDGRWLMTEFTRDRSPR